MGGRDPTGQEPVPHKLVELPRVQHHGRARFERVRDVNDDYVVSVCGLFEIGNGVGKVELEAWIIERALVMVRKMFPAHLYNVAVNVDHRHSFDGGVREGLPNGRTLATARDEHRLRLGVGNHARLDQRFVIDELIHCSGLRLAVEDQRPSEGVAVVDFDFLKRGLALEYDPFDSLRLVEVGRYRLRVPTSRWKFKG